MRKAVLRVIGTQHRFIAVAAKTADIHIIRMKMTLK